VYSLFGDSENREKNYLKIRDLLSIALFNILGTHYLIQKPNNFNIFGSRETKGA
jgi:hypothetical protein